MRVGGVVACAAVLLSGCGSPGPVQVDGPKLLGTDAAQCRRLVQALPDTVAGQKRRNISPADAPAAAWGDPAIVLRCGVHKPAALRPTSFCLEVNHVGWLATQGGKAVPMSRPAAGTVDFTTIGRSVYVELSVPGAYQPQVDALPAMARPVSVATQDVHPCL